MSSLPPKNCIDCNKKFIPKSNRQLRCPKCQVEHRRKVKREYNKKIRKNRILDGRAIIKMKDDIEILEPISHRGRLEISKHIKTLGNIVHEKNFLILIKNIKQELKYEKNKNKIKELRIKITLLNDWYKIFKQERITVKNSYEIERVLDNFLSDISLNDLFQYKKYKSNHKNPIKLNNEKLNKIKQKIEPLEKCMKEIYDSLLEFNCGFYDTIPEAILNPIGKVIEYRLLKRKKKLPQVINYESRKESTYLG